MRRLYVIPLLLALLVSSASQAQKVRTDRDGLGGTLSRAYKRAAEDQIRTDWPIKSKGRPGTAVRLTFDARNADVDIITDRSYGSDRLLATERDLAQEMDLPHTDFIRSTESDTAVSVDMEFNDYLVHPARRVTVFDFDLARFADALRKTDLPRPIVFGIRSNHSSLNQVTLLMPDGARLLEGIVFLRADEVRPGTRLHWKAQVHWSGYVMAVLLFGLFACTPILFLVAVWKGPKAVASPSLDPGAVQKRYDKSPPRALLLFVMPLLSAVLFVIGNASRAMESMMYVLPLDMLKILVIGLSAVMMGTLLLKPVIHKIRPVRHDIPASDPDEPPSWTKTAFISGMMPGLLLPMALVILPQARSALRSLPPEWRRSAPIWLPIAMLVIGFLPAIVAGTLASRKIRRTLKPGDHWYDRVMTLARQANVPVKRVMEIWSAAPNAFANIFGDVGVTRGLLRKLEPEEVDVVIAHELGHHIGGHPRRMFVRSLAVTIALLGLWWGLWWYLEHHFRLSAEMKVALRSPMFVFLVLPLLRSFLMGTAIRKRELEADRFAVDVTRDAELVIRALTRIHDLNAIPHRLKPADEAIHSHPSLEHRVAAIREYAAYGKGARP